MLRGIKRITNGVYCPQSLNVHPSTSVGMVKATYRVAQKGNIRAYIDRAIGQFWKRFSLNFAMTCAWSGYWILCSSDHFSLQWSFPKLKHAPFTLSMPPCSYADKQMEVTKWKK